MENNDKKVVNLFIVQPMHGLSTEEVQASRVIPMKKLMRYYEDIYYNGISFNIVDNLHHDLPEGSPRLKYLGASIAKLADTDLVYFLHGWESAKGCNVEMTACEQYEIPHICEDDLNYDV